MARFPVGASNDLTFGNIPIFPAYEEERPELRLQEPIKTTLRAEGDKRITPHEVLSVRRAHPFQGT